MLLESLLLPGVLVPAVFAAVAYGLLEWIGRRHEGPSAAGAGALAAAFLAASVATAGWPRWPPIAAIQRVFFLVALAAIVVWGIGRLGRARTPWIARVIMVLLVLVLALESQIKNRWSGGQTTLWIPGLLIAGVAIAWALDASFARGGTRLERWSDGWLPAAVRLALVGSTALILGLSESARLAQLTGSLACGMTVVEILGRLRRHKPWQGIDSLVLATALIGLLSIGYFYAALGRWPAALLVLAFVLLALSHKRGVGRALLPLVPLVLALTLVIITFLNQEEDPYNYYSQRSDRADSLACVVADPLAALRSTHC